jgi:hypothetical protein
MVESMNGAKITRFGCRCDESRMEAQGTLRASGQ